MNQSDLARPSCTIDLYNTNLIFMPFIEIDEQTILEYKTLKTNTLCSEEAGYQRIKTIPECKSAALALGNPSKIINLVPIELSTLGPTGCLFDTREQRMYFNPFNLNGENGVASSIATPICGKQGKEKHL